MVALALLAALFEFHSPFWLDLHHRLYAESGRLQIEHQMPPDAQQRWKAALAAYRESYPDRTLATLFRSDAAQATRRALEGDDLSGVDPKLRAILQAVSPVYREHIWPADEKADARFIEALQPLLAKHGETVAKNLAAALGGAPPQGAMRADVTAFAGPVGAYTILGPVLIAISSTDERHQGPGALESLFHEAGHALIFPLARELRTALEEAGKPDHDDLWHALLFFTAGEVVKRQLGPAYVPYADAQHLWERAPKWSSYRPLLEKHWIPVIDGKATPSAGLKALVAAL
jgi:hypothetical protein